MTELGCDDTETAGTLFNNWALALHLSGRPLDAEKFYRRAMQISTGHSDERVSPMLLVNYARTLRELGRGPEAAQYAEQGHARAQQSGDDVVVNQSLLLLARIYRDQGNLARSEAMLAEVEPRLRKALPPGHIAFATVASEHALLDSARGDLASALHQADQALAITTASTVAGHGGGDYVPYLLIVRSDIERELGRTDDAAADATQALGALQKVAEPGAYSNALGHAYYSLGRALQRQGKSADARNAFSSAAEHFQNTLGANHPDTLTARQMATSAT